MAQCPFTNLTQDLVWRNNSSLVHTSDLQRKEKKNRCDYLGQVNFSLGQVKKKEVQWSSEQVKQAFNLILTILVILNKNR